MTVTKSQSSKHSQEKNKESGRKWDGRSRPSNDLYKKNYDEIFRKDKTKEKDKETNKQR